MIGYRNVAFSLATSNRADIGNLRMGWGLTVNEGSLGEEHSVDPQLTFLKNTKPLINQGRRHAGVGDVLIWGYKRASAHN